MVRAVQGMSLAVVIRFANPRGSGLQKRYAIQFNNVNHNLQPITSQHVSLLTSTQDETLRNAVLSHKGKNWKKIAEHVKDRTDVQCLHRWQKVLNPELVKGPWTKEVIYNQFHESIPCSNFY